jgi:signal transduction histidine kinase
MVRSEGRPRARGSLWRDCALYAVVWTLLGLFSAAQIFATHIFEGQPIDWARTVGTELLNWYTCGIDTPVYIWLVRRFPLKGPYFARRAALYVVILLLSVPVKYLIWVPLQNAAFHSGWTFANAVVPNVFAVFMGQLYFVVLLYAVEYYRAARERDLRAARLETELSQAQLDLLRSQMHPHFLFNTLNSVSALMHRDVAAADEMLSRLSDMLRASFACDDGQETSLGRELQLAQLYLDIMHVRFRDRLVFAIDAPQGLLDEQVPSFLLQPIVENAVQHGIDGSSEVTSIGVLVSADDRDLCIRVVDDGAGLPPNAALRAGIGLQNTRRRIEALYGGAGSLRVLARDGGGTEVVIGVPRRHRALTIASAAEASIPVQA